MAKPTYSFLLRFDIEDKTDKAIYAALLDSAYDNGRSLNKEILHALKKTYKVKAGK